MVRYTAYMPAESAWLTKVLDRKFHMPRFDPECECLSYEQVNERVHLPDVQTQDHLISLYFTYVHPFFPLIHKSSFLTAYYER